MLKDDLNFSDKVKYFFEEQTSGNFENTSLQPTDLKESQVFPDHQDVGNASLQQGSEKVVGSVEEGAGTKEELGMMFGGGIGGGKLSQSQDFSDSEEENPTTKQVESV